MCDMSAASPKNWGTIFLGTDREVNLDQLSHVAPKGGAFWRHDQEAGYLERVQQRATEQARAILMQAGRERAALLDETHGEIARIREETEQQAAALLAESRSKHAEAARLHEEAKRLHAGAEEAGHAAGYAAGMEEAQADLEHFRAVMGESTGAVLSAVHAQCDRIFAIWKEDLCSLLLACVEKGMGLALDKDRALLLEHLLLDSVKLFAARSSVLVRVQPADEALVADIFAAAKERIPGLASWSVQGDPDLAPGDLVLEAEHSRVESRLEERREIVDAALRHVELPAVPEEESGREELAQVTAGAVARMFELVPKRSGGPVLLHGAVAADGAEAPHPEAEHDAPAAEDSAHAAGNVDMSQVCGRAETMEPAVLDATDAADVDAVLAEGGFLPGSGRPG
jgi:flagellar assembly protein FliH